MKKEEPKWVKMQDLPTYDFVKNLPEKVRKIGLTMFQK